MVNYTIIVGSNSHYCCTSQVVHEKTIERIIVCSSEELETIVTGFIKKMIASRFDSNIVLRFRPEYIAMIMEKILEHGKIFDSTGCSCFTFYLINKISNETNYNIDISEPYPTFDSIFDDREMDKSESEEEEEEEEDEEEDEEEERKGEND